MYWNKTLAGVVCMLCALAARAETPKLTIEEVDQMSQAKIVQDLTGTGGGTKPSPAPVATSVQAPAPAPASTPVVVQKPVRSVAPEIPVTFVGAYRDDHSGSFVLYEYNDAVYTARVGEKLLNGWTARKVDGFMVTVASGAGMGGHTWTVPIRPMTQAVTLAGSTATTGYAGTSLQAIRDLGSPLPPGGAIVRGGAQ